MISLEQGVLYGGAGLCAAVTMAGLRGVCSPRSSLFGDVVWRGGASAGAADSAALTFDDGPWPGATGAILDILRRHDVRAAFFVIGRYALRHPELLRRAREEGHLIGNHSFDHSRAGIFRLGSYWNDQIQRAGDAVEEALGLRPALFRPPMGLKSPHVMGASARQRCRVVTWSRRALDGVARPADEIVRHAAGAARGDIVLLHDGRDPASRRELGATAAALPRIIDRIRASGLTIERLDAFTGLAAYQEVPTLI